jgi:hypothetical protein
MVIEKKTKLQALGQDLALKPLRRSRKRGASLMQRTMIQF